ncbi:MAG TPA: PAS domain-containing protein [Acidimicrobiia bacterium]|nr:PAS domain-containing protein [Acidimicrobiia bacterium]
MAQEPIEIILLRQLSSYLMLPIWITDDQGNLIYYNEPAEDLLGRRFDIAGEIPAEELAELFVTSHLDGSPIPNEELPLMVALTEHHPAHQAMRIKRFDGALRTIEVTSVPVVGQGDRFLGTFNTFWEKR